MEVNATDSYGRTALHNAAYGGHAAVVRALLEHETSSNWTAVDKDGNTPLRAAEKKGRTLVVDLLKVLA